jgi:hypothetical protein
MVNPKIQGLACVYGMQDNTAAATVADPVFMFAAETAQRDFISQSAGVSSADKVLDLTGGSGKIVTTILQEQITDVEFDLVPIGIGARTTPASPDSGVTAGAGPPATGSTIALARVASVIPRKNDKLVTASFTVADYNGTWRIMDSNTKMRSDGVLIFHVKAQTSENITSLVGTAITT